MKIPVPFGLSGLLSTACLLICQPTQANTITATGMAALDVGTRDQARQLAIADALEQAAIEAGVRISGNQSISQPDQQTLNLEPIRRPTQHHVKREWVDRNLLMVEVDATFDDSMPNPGSMASSASQELPNCNAGNPRLRRTVVVTPFQISQPGQAGDWDNPSQNLANELIRRLTGKPGVFPVGNAGVSVFDPSPAAGQSMPPGALIQQVAVNHESQFVVTGRLLDAGISGTSKRYYWGLNTDVGNALALGVELPNTPLGAGVRERPSQRRVELEYFVHDGATGVLLDRQRIAKEAQGEVVLNRQQSLGSAGFNNHDYGRIVNQTLEEAAKQIALTLQCLPFTTKLAKLEGKTAYLAAGSIHNLRPGDRLLAYSKDTRNPVFSPDTYQPLGLPERPRPVLQIMQVQPRFAIARVIGNNSLKVGDWVRDDIRPGSNESVVMDDPATSQSTETVPKLPSQMASKSRSSKPGKSGKPATKAPIKKPAPTAKKKGKADCECPDPKKQG
ncbi:flagella assembly protein FlgT middle domain-containing protein [Chitinivorax sp. B]|uniref:flagella assembly protein FlgT middle domain-containing protein n=1 Tax=Chitinivorax sp. B TaxID=2502235 RepID=UPI0010F5F56D|nr:flagella assembly protein FlgT middle domain-containing protein [Chitinivorax sp. B]